jgi:hypothetical protein
MLVLIGDLVGLDCPSDGYVDLDLSRVESRVVEAK